MTSHAALVMEAGRVTHGELALPAGLYESLITTELEQALDGRGERSGVDPADQPHVLARHIYDLTARALSGVKDPRARIELANRIIETVGAASENVAEPVEQLFRLGLAAAPGRHRHEDVRPRTPLSDAALLTNARDEPSLGAELRAELDTSDEVDLLCAFVKWYGLRVLEPQLSRLRDRGAPLRVITTTYVGATERLALERLISDFGAEVKIQYDTARTRLHAKAWLFRRNTGFDTAYVGSSNLSSSALLEGVEWNVRLSRVGTPSLLDKFRATFDTYWNDATFETYDPARDRDRLDDALAEASGRRTHDRVTISLSGLEVRPFPHQQEMLDSIDAERREHDRHRNLVVAATGTGKTVVAALDYRRLSSATDGARPRLLFVAHRREILTQSLRTYREVLNDPNFGELYVDGSRPERWHHVFASIQSLSGYGISNLPADAFDVVVIDEFHHAQATTYRRILDHLQPRELLGLTATPERADGMDVRTFFDDRTAAELRLWDALGADLLCPFHYFVVADGTDLTRVSWKGRRYDERELSSVFTGNEARARIVLTQLKDKVPNTGDMRALGFCVSVAHAEYMAEVFRAAGVPAVAVSGETPRLERERGLDALRARQVNVLFAADLFNEGLDLPEVDTVLFLRPTESATIFLQQLGRGLRRAPDKPVLTVLDFVGFHRKEFRFDNKFRALTGRTRSGLVRDLERGFPFLPSGCQILMDEQAQAIVLDNIKSQLSRRFSDIAAELRQYGEHDLRSFLRESDLELADILRNNHSWTELRRSAGLPTPDGGAHESRLLRRVRALAHVDDHHRATAYLDVLRRLPDIETLTPTERKLARMLGTSIWYDARPDEIEERLASLAHEPAFRSEASQVIDVSFDQAHHVTHDFRLGNHDPGLRVHARYQREEILAALDFPRSANSFREGVWYSPDHNVDAFFVTLKKSEADYSPTTMYRDFPISPTLFHWESQSTTSVTSKTGKRYLDGSSTVLIFARLDHQSSLGTAPYLFLGRAKYREHSGDRPIAVTWELERPMPSDFFTAGSVAAM